MSTDGAEKFKEELLSIVTDGDLFTRDEARILIRSVRSETPEGIPDAIGAVVTWARNVRSKSAVLDVILKLGASDMIDVRPTGDGDIEMKLSLNPDEVEIRP